MPDTLPPVPDPEQKPVTADEMARENEREGEVLVERDHSQGAPEGEELRSSSMSIPVPSGD